MGRNRAHCGGNCKLRGALAQAQRAFYDSLDAHTIDELASSSARITLLSIGTPTRTTASGTEDAAGIR